MKRMHCYIILFIWSNLGTQIHFKMAAIDAKVSCDIVSQAAGI